MAVRIRQIYLPLQKLVFVLPEWVTS